MPTILTSAPTTSEKEAVYRWLREFNYSENKAVMTARDSGAERPLFLVARDETTGNVVGGLEGILFLKWLRVEIMAIAPEMRGKGIGSRLLQHAEKTGRNAGCIRAYVDTMSYQAPAFYRKHGFQEVGKLPDWDSHGHDKFFFMKELLPLPR